MTAIQAQMWRKFKEADREWVRLQQLVAQQHVAHKDMYQATRDLLVQYNILLGIGEGVDIDRCKEEAAWLRSRAQYHLNMARRGAACRTL